MKNHKRPRLLFFVTEDWYFAMHFIHFAVAAKNSGWEVALVCNTGQKGPGAIKQILASGIKVIQLKLSRGGINPIEDLMAFVRIFAFTKSWKPDVFHAVALKPLIHGFFLRLLSGLTILNMITGLGFIYTSKSWKARLLKPFITVFLKLALNFRSAKLVVLNFEDAVWANSTFNIPEHNLEILPGIGIDTDRFCPGTPSNLTPVIIFTGRLLRDKGLFELFSAAKLLKDKGINFKLVLAGAVDPSNPESISEAQIDEWHRLDYVEFLGHVTNVQDFLRNSDIMVLPSYREGMPTSILEAAASGLPCVTTDVPGCREAVINNVTGLIVPARDEFSLSEALEKLLADISLRKQLGDSARKMVLEKYSMELVLDKMLKIYENALGHRSY